ncbi:hypothetical protein KCP75_09355 [Salmonella enterica subsp. enterica]|nr:hypothetical protein KCP75_09355 [Salmonella enterica subsp. enterica]
MVRVTAGRTTDQLQNNTVWSSYAKGIDVRQRYPNTAVIGRHGWNAGRFPGSQQVEREITIFPGGLFHVPSSTIGSANLQRHLGRHVQACIQQ